jgi:NADPH:quinone reductase-like Zn-dependent oxidoreductase
MKAIVQDTYGSADVLQLRDIDRPEIGEHDVLIHVRAAGVDPGVWHIMTGKPYLLRAIGFGLTKPKGAARGRDVAGVVEAVGSGVTRFTPGDEVYGTCESGSFAEFASAREGRLALKPSGLTFEQAASMPISAGTALQAVRDAGRVEAGQRVMVIGAAGGVGSFAVQIAAARGAIVTAVCSAARADLVRGLGATDVIDYSIQEVDCNGPVYDVIIDTAGNRSLSLLRRAMTPGGVLVIIGGEQSGGSLLGGFDRQLRAPLASLFSSQRMVGLVSKERAEDYQALAQLVDSGAVTPVVDRVFALSESADALRYVESGHARGKVVVSV